MGPGVMLRAAATLVMGTSLRRTAKLPLVWSSLTLSSGTVISPAVSLLKTMELPAPRSKVPVSWSPLVKRMTSGAGLDAGAAGSAAFAWPRAGAVARASSSAAKEIWARRGGKCKPFRSDDVGSRLGRGGGWIGGLRLAARGSCREGEQQRCQGDLGEEGRKLQAFRKERSEERRG